MEYEISFEVPHQIFVIDADDEFDAAEKIKGQMDGITIDESFKQKYRDNAQLHYPTEIEKFKNRL